MRNLEPHPPSVNVHLWHKKLFKNTWKKNENMKSFNKIQLLISYEAFKCYSKNNEKTKITVLKPALIERKVTIWQLTFFQCRFQRQKVQKARNLRLSLQPWFIQNQNQNHIFFASNMFTSLTCIISKNNGIVVLKFTCQP